MRASDLIFPASFTSFPITFLFLSLLCITVCLIRVPATSQNLYLFYINFHQIYKIEIINNCNILFLYTQNKMMNKINYIYLLFSCSWHTILCFQYEHIHRRFKWLYDKLPYRCFGMRLQLPTVVSSSGAWNLGGSWNIGRLIWLLHIWVLARVDKKGRKAFRLG